MSLNIIDKNALSRVLRHDFGGFIRQCFSSVCPGQAYQHNWHIDLIADHLNACAEGDISRLIINIPPRSLKSICVSVAWPAWLLGVDPRLRIIAASYSQALSTKHSVDTRLVMQSEWYQNLFPETMLSKDQNEKHKFVTTQRGMRLATSVWGTATGEGGNILIADDPINPLQAMSAAGRKFANEWFDHTFSTRLDDKRNGCIVLVMQRLHEGDLSGHLIRKGGWDLLRLPAIAQVDEKWCVNEKDYHRKRGELLHEERENAALIERAKTELGSQNFAAQYQQNPLPNEGGMIKLEWFKRFYLNTR